ncbi:MAG: membrane lipoprotein lipid attachment site-containing protein [Anaerolineales bacterium]|nr:membrane lipoprotein lipid attachment site-containing protein [Anaerolineales bacterium]MDP2776791.1 membrane lipoprotein lipid attachment site-containing protein [Anaerolineales bacterium]
MKRVICFFVLMLILSACAPAEFQGTNPKDAKVEIVDGVVTIRISASTPHFWLEKVNDDSVAYNRIFVKIDSDQKNFLYKTDLEDWQMIPMDEKIIRMGQVQITLEDGILITYPSGTWAFP